MDPRLEAYVAQVQGIVQQKLSSTGRIRQLRAAAELLVTGGLELGPEHRKLPDEGYGRNLLYRDPDFGFVVIAMIWPAGYVGVPHDHKTWGVVAVLEGEVEVTTYERDDDGTDPEQGKLTEIETIRGTTGTVAQVLPPHHDIHAVSNASSTEQAVTIHSYGRDAETVTCFERDTGVIEVVRPTYTTLPTAVCG